ncbi:AP-like endonuclease reverse transcriptase [Brachionus plicatilis]|uniref:AP-like endonuclease reverse transcriptase n=1 Tax=Brachionus plicatilis TaxID=10195 RepID=A0A3M7P3K5_BRAPC|nr:AP-like endonuclease reverse transcriptase [Brachionus plicatilis]
MNEFQKLVSFNSSNTTETTWDQATLTNWTESFLKDRTFQEQYNEATSRPKKIECVVPQASCLSPTLFILYFSDIAKLIPPNVKIAIYADDLCIWYTGSSKREIKRVIQRVINIIVEFCKKWGMTIKKEKTCYTAFTSAGLRQNYTKKYSFNLKIANQNIQFEPNPTFLGVTLDPKINFKEHPKQVEKKIIPKINLIKHIKNFKWSNSSSIDTILYKSLIR